MKNTSFYNSSLDGLTIHDVNRFGIKTSDWKNSIFRYFFGNYGINSNVEKESSLNLIIEKIFAILLLVVFFPVMLCIALVNKVSSKGDILYKQVRIGKGGKPFNIYKFRSMVMDAEAKTGHTLSWSGDPRITKFGYFLRKSHLDELPQLFNVLLGDMSFVGPRPERPEFTSIYESEIENYVDRSYVRPGITGLAQIALMYDATAEEKLKYDLMYIGFKESWLLNSLIVFYTAKKMAFMQSNVEII